MRILFIENRTSTVIWEKAAHVLAAHGHEVHWLVQNHLYAPKAANVHLVPYPAAADLSDGPLDPALAQIARTDRAVLNFGVKPSHYPHYWKHVGALLDRLAPEVVFGESTNFHELMAIHVCKARGTPYVAPLETRYPAGRIVFFRYDTFEPIGGCHEPLSPQANRELLDRIVKRDVRPAYMEAPSGAWNARVGRWSERLRLTRAWLLGERFLTPSPLRHIRLNRTRDRTKAAWDAMARQRSGFNPRADRAWVLYPLQLQPESNLDVFGQPWNNQCETMARAAAALAPMGARLVVKPNPKSKYEMMPALLEAARRHDNIVPLEHAYPMSAVFPDAPLVLSVTGTVILESIFSGKPVAVLGDHQMTSLAGVTRLGAPEQVAAVLQEVLAGRARRATRDEGEATLQWLHETSYGTRFFDPVQRPDLLTGDTIRKLQAAFLDVLAHAMQPRGM